MNVFFLTFCQVFALVVAIPGSTATNDEPSPSSFRKDVHVLLYENNPDFEHDTFSSLHFFKERSTIANLHTTVFGGKLQRPGFGDKLQLLKPLLEVVEPDELIIVADAREVALNVPDDKEVAIAAVDRFLETFHKLTANTPGAVVMTADDHCCRAAMSHAAPSDYFDASAGARQFRACASGKDDCVFDDNENIAKWEEFMKEVALKRTEGDEEYRSVFLNDGVVAGYPRDLIQMLNLMDLSAEEDDQAVLSGLMYAFPDMILLDYHQELFGNNQKKNGLAEGCVFQQQINGFPLYHTGKMTQPLILHTPDGFYQCLDVLIEILGGESQKRYLLSTNDLDHLLAENEKERDLQSVSESDSNYGYGNYYGQYGNYGYGNYGPGNYGYGNYGYGNYANGNQYGNYGGYGNYGKYGNYGYGNYGNYGYGNYGNYGYGNYGYGNYGNYGYSNYGVAEGRRDLANDSASLRKLHIRQKKM